MRILNILPLKQQNALNKGILIHKTFKEVRIRLVQIMLVHLQITVVGAFVSSLRSRKIMVEELSASYFFHYIFLK